ncbi:hypothetical protein [Streptomyces sp. bgisy032]|uniref:hypothetical protein n=1 Tax=Streptomyces sp. bgisy032 TaxID=3413773 RepID=UPI003D71A3FA
MLPLEAARRDSECDRMLAQLAAAEAPDEYIRDPLWTWHPYAVKAVLSERRRRFGIEDERIDPAALEEDDDA